MHIRWERPSSRYKLDAFSSPFDDVYAAGGKAVDSPYANNEIVRLRAVQRLSQMLPFGALPGPLRWLLQRTPSTALDMLQDLEYCVHRLHCPGPTVRARHRVLLQMKFVDIKAVSGKLLHQRQLSMQQGKSRRGAGLEGCLSKATDYENLPAGQRHDPQQLGTRLQIECTQGADLSVVALQLEQAYLRKVASFNSAQTEVCSPQRL